ncbi:methyltransferase domain-containing protein [Methanococcoides sp. SA1]|nr:methyltransferase domain-containing protein [Methanococcoides sp. SA1]
MGKNNPQTSTDEHRLVEEVKKKKEFSGLPDSVVRRALDKSGDDIKEARKWLRKYFGVFLTNRVLKGKDEMLKVHMSSKKRDYKNFYTEIFEEFRSFGVSGFRIPQKTGESATPAVSCGHLANKGDKDKLRVLDLGCGVNGFSYEYLPCGTKYVGVEAAGQLVDQMNLFFEENGFDGEAVKGDLMDLDFVEDILEKGKFDVCFLFQVVDALESIERNFSLKLISLIMEKVSCLVISVPLVSLGGRKKFAVQRKWLMDYLRSEFVVEKDFEMFGERIIVVGKS